MIICYSTQVDFREFIIGLSTLLRGTTVERLKWVFNMYDLDSNGSVTKDELIHVLKVNLFYFQIMNDIIWDKIFYVREVEQMTEHT